ncbi:MAG TPA: hypothetical protein VIU33_04450 [Nitrospiria bacterium]
MNPLGIFFREAGTTLIELLVGTALFLVIFAAGVQFLGIQNRWTVSQERTGEAQRQAWMALDMMQREISLAGSGLSEDEAVFLVAEESEVAFLSNIDREVTVLTASAARGDTQIQVAGSTFRQGTDFEDGNEVRLCNEGVCEQHRLAGEAGRYSLEFREPVRGAFPPGSTVDVVHRIHYRLKKNDSGGFKLIRIVDGGGGPLAENISEMRLRYFDRSGRQVSGPEGIRAVGITIHVRVPGRPAAGRHLEGLAAVRNGR